MQKLLDVLNAGKPARTADLTDDEKLDRPRPLPHHHEAACSTSPTWTRPASPNGNEYTEAGRDSARPKRGSEVVRICGAMEAEIAQLEPAERAEFLEAAGLEEPGLNRLIHAAYRLLGLITYFTSGVQEVRAWTIKRGTKAPGAAGVIHSDFERGFIKADATPATTSSAWAASRP